MANTGWVHYYYDYCLLVLLLLLDCSIANARTYLSHHCPLLIWRKHVLKPPAPRSHILITGGHRSKAMCCADRRSGHPPGRRRRLSQALTHGPPGARRAPWRGSSSVGFSVLAADFWRRWLRLANHLNDRSTLNQEKKSWFSIFKIEPQPLSPPF